MSFHSEIAAAAHPTYPLSLGAIDLGSGRCRFEVWASKHERVELHLVGPQDRLLPMEPVGRGYFRLEVEGVGPGTRYFYRLDGKDDRPDPASRFQPDGVHKASAVVRHDFAWDERGWRGLPLKDYVIYELHVGTFSPEGTFEGIIPYLDELKSLGITAIEILPVSQFPGGRNWGYDGVHLFAPQNTYGGPEGLKRLVNACHQRGLAFVMDVVYNHLGPEGNYLGQFADYFTDRYHTPWGMALNFDGPDSDEVRRYFIENALYWVEEFHVDALRLDAVHAILDHSAYPFLQELQDALVQDAQRLNRQVFTIAESDLNDTRLIRAQELGGMGLDTQWSDDFHHALHVILTGERTGYYEDISGFADLVRAYRDGFARSGQYSPFRKRRHGNSSRELPPTKFVICSQNHDQVGNRLLGDRLAATLDFEQLKLEAGVLLLSPYVPMLFMGQEYGETAPFQYFVSHTDPGLVEAVRKGRFEEFAAFGWQDEAPDPQSEQTFNRCKLNHALKREGRHKLLWEFYRELLRLRRTLPALTQLSKEHMSIAALQKARVMAVGRWTEHQEVLAAFHFGPESVGVDVPIPAGRWNKVLDSADDRWRGPGSQLPQEVASAGEVTLTLPPHGLVVYSRDHTRPWLSA